MNGSTRQDVILDVCFQRYSVPLLYEHQKTFLGVRNLKAIDKKKFVFEIILKILLESLD